MKMTGRLCRLPNQSPRRPMGQCIATGIGVAVFLMTGSAAVAQNPTPLAEVATPITHPVAPKGYTLHQTIDLGGRIAQVTGSGAMYDTLVNLRSGPRVLGETFVLRALPGAQHTPVDSLRAFSSGFGGDPYNFANLNFYKGKLYEFSGLFRRDRSYFDYGPLGNPNIPAGQSIPIGPANAPTGSFAWPQAEQSPFLFNTVRRMTDTSVTLFPLSRVMFRAGYTQNVMQGPSLSPAYAGAGVGATDQLLGEFQRNSSDDFFAEIDWKPWRDTTLTYQEQIDHIKEDSYFTLGPSSFLVQEANGAAVAPGGWDNLSPYGVGNCNTNSLGAASTTAAGATILSPAPAAGGKPVINSACSVATSYLRSQPTRILFPTEIFRFQSARIANIAMNGDARYTNANMTLPDYYENFQGLDATVRSIVFTGQASARRQVMAADYAIVWDAAKNIRFSEQVDFSNVQQPGTANISKGITANTPKTPGSETLSYAGPLTPGTATVEGSPNGTPLPGYFGLKLLTNDVTATWDGWSRATLSMTWRYRAKTISQGFPHNTPLPVGNDSDGTVVIHENGGVFNAALRPSKDWTFNASVELLYADNAFTPVSPRETEHYRIHTLFKPKPWATLSGVVNDLERHNNTNNNQAAVAAGDVKYVGPIAHYDHSRYFSIGADLFPVHRYGISFNYAYSDVAASTNICYTASSTSTYPGAAPANGAACPGTIVRGATYYEFGPVKDFINAPTQFGFVAFDFSPLRSVQSTLGYSINSVNGTRFFNDARDVNGTLVSTYHTPEVSIAWTAHERWIWKADYKFTGYGEGGPSGAPNCSLSNPTLTTPAPVVPCNSPSLAGLQTGLTILPNGETAPRNFHAHLVTLGMHYEF
jgi:hypothetical protein